MLGMIYFLSKRATARQHLVHKAGKNVPVRNLSGLSGETSKIPCMNTSIGWAEVSPKAMEISFNHTVQSLLTKLLQRRRKFLCVCEGEAGVTKGMKNQPCLAPRGILQEGVQSHRSLRDFHREKPDE